MKLRKIIVIKHATLANDDEWWDSQTKEFQKDYIEQHPNSKYAKNAKKAVEKKVDKPAKAIKEKKDSYADVPEKERKVMIEAKSRGFTVPPAWREVWLNPDPTADLQVKGRDKKNRPQYLYSVSFRNQQDALKFERLKTFTQEYPEITAKIDADLEKSEEAKVLYLISKTGFRIGSTNDTGAEKQAYGASTLTSDHIKIDGDTVHFDFIGKEGVRQQHSVKDAKLVKMFEGKKGALFDSKPAKIHKYLDSVSKEHYKVKDFRTYVGTSTALHTMKDIEKPKNKKELDKAILLVCKTVSAKLGNTPKMARDSYIDPLVFKHWSEDIEMEQQKEQSSDRSEQDQAMVDFIETNHYQYNKKLVAKYREVQALPEGAKRKIAFKEFQDLAKSLKLVNTKDKPSYLKSLQQLQTALKRAK